MFPVSRFRSRFRVEASASALALNLDFVNVDPLNPQLDPRITFTRASNATVTDSSGVLTYAPHNLLTYSEQFDNIAWAKNGATVVANTTVAPDGTLTGDKFVEDSTTTVHRFTRGQAVVAGTRYVVTVYLKQGERRYFGFKSGIFGQPQPVFDLQTGTVVEGVGTITAVENGWYRCSATFVADSFAAYIMYWTILKNPTFTGESYLGDGTSGIYIWGAQLNVDALQPYYQTVASAYYGPRFDYDPVTLAPRGLLIEEQRTNLRTFSESVLTVSLYGANNSTLTSTTTQTPIQGLTTASKFALNSGANTGNNTDGFNFGTAITLAASTAHTQSMIVKADGASVVRLRSNVNGQLYDIPIAGPAPSPVGSVTACSVQQLGNGWARVAWTFTTAASGTPGTRSDYWAIKSNVADGTSGYLVTGAQLEVGASPTSYIPTTTAAVTRAADVATMTGTNFSSWYNATEGTFYSETQLLYNSAGTFPGVFSANNGTATDQIMSYYVATNRQQLYVRSGGTITVDIGATATANSVFKFAGAYKTNDCATTTNGAGVITDTSATLPAAPNRLNMGSQASFGYLNGHIRRIAYYPRRLSGAELQGLTT
jgi:hypothetical protein